MTAITGGCSDDFHTIDSKSFELMRERSLRIGSTLPPDHSPPVDVNRLNDPSLTSKSPPTTNPPGTELSFKVADEARDVAARLAQFQQADLGSGRHLTLFDAFRQAQETGREHLTAEEDYLLAAIRLMVERHLWGPRLFNDTSVNFNSNQTDGATRSAMQVVNDLRATQRLPYGGEVEARWIWNASENLRSAATGQYVQSSALALTASIPLMRGAGLYAQEELIQAERNLVYAARDYEQFRREYLVSIARDYFSLVQQMSTIENTRKQLAGFVRIETQEKALFEAGRIPQLRVNNAANQVKQAEDSLANQLDAYTLALDRFKVRLGLPVTTPVVIDASELPISEPDVDINQAVEAALLYRLDLQNRRDGVEDTRRQVKNAKNQLLPDVTLSGNLTFPTDASAREGGAVYEPDDVQYGANAKVSLPLDRQVEKLGVRTATIGFQRAERELDRFRDEVILQVRSKVRALDLSRNSLTLSTQRVELTRRRKEEQDIKRDEFTTQELLDAENDLAAAENARAQALTNLRNAVLDYLVTTGQLRVTRDGQLEMLPGMMPTVVPPSVPAP